MYFYIVYKDVSKLTITNVATMKNFGVMFNRFTVHNLCRWVMWYLQTQNKSVIILTDVQDCK